MFHEIFHQVHQDSKNRYESHVRYVPDRFVKCSICHGNQGSAKSAPFQQPDSLSTRPTSVQISNTPGEDFEASLPTKSLVAFDYEPVKEDGTIRLLGLSPGNSLHEPLRGTLFQAKLEDSLKYEPYPTPGARRTWYSQSN